MGKFCTSCGMPLNEEAKFCTKCGANVFQSNEPAQISAGQPDTTKFEQKIPKTIRSEKKKPSATETSADSSYDVEGGSNGGYCRLHDGGRRSRFRKGSCRTGVR